MLPILAKLSGGGIAGLVIAIVFVIAISVFLIVFFYRRSFLYITGNLKKRLDGIHITLTSDCKNSLTRLETLGKQNKKFEEFFLERNDQYATLCKTDKNIAKDIENLDELIKSKDLKQVKDIEREIIDSLNRFEKTVSSFSTDLSAILQDDTDTANSAVPVKANFRKVNEFYAKNQNELAELSPSFEAILQNAKDGFEKYQSLVDQALFAQAKQELNDINQILTATIAVMDQLPMLQASIYTVLPNKLDDLESAYHQMLDEDYVVEYLNVDNIVSSIRKELEVLKSNLIFLDISGAQEKIDKMQTTITDLNAKFNEEKNMKIAYLNSTTNLTDTTYTLEKNYCAHMNQIDQYKKAYVLDSRYVNQMIQLKNNIEYIGILKREVDSYLDTSNRQPYTKIMKKIGELRTDMAKAERTMSDYQNYLDGLKNTAQEIYDGLRNLFISLRVDRANVINLRVDIYTNSLKPKFEHYFEKIAELSNVLYVTPLDIKQLYQQYRSLQDDCNNFLEDIHKHISDANRAEQLIVRSNSVREDFSDCREILTKAEESYHSGDFQHAIEFASKALTLFTNSISTTETNS